MPPRALNYRGYATRKLGRTDEGIGYYLKSVGFKGRTGVRLSVRCVTRHRYSIGLLPASWLSPPRSGLERSDFVPWPIALVPLAPRSEGVRPNLPYRKRSISASASVICLEFRPGSLTAEYFVGEAGRDVGTASGCDAVPTFIALTCEGITANRTDNRRSRAIRLSLTNASKRNGSPVGQQRPLLRSKLHWRSPK
jgi:hypothetical protein